MKNINEMDYQELIDLERQIEEAKKKFYKVCDLYIVEGHLCTSEVVGNYNFMGTRTRVEYTDVFSGEYVSTYYIDSLLPSLRRVLDEHDISYNDYMDISELSKVWIKYKKSHKVLQKIVS